MSDCIFCQIIQGQIPASKVYEDEQVLAFLDITQVTKGHTLVVPKKHARNILDMNEETASALFAKVPAIARRLKDQLGAKGINVINNNEEAAGQTVFHTHIHLLPRYDQNDELQIGFTAHEPDFPALAQLSEQLHFTN
ncbi:HIT family protein [Streptococcus sp. X16XC17]|uniref:HIT family protein n=1 Tax=unclassified Streptococcus TaxID=2608887 RepID=UPI00066FDACD|nr:MULTISPECIES: HIT family protein [unclassified Streptococcus]TCD45657.1 HIT family protein [Streptococcus sp. X16XC17]